MYKISPSEKPNQNKEFQLKLIIIILITIVIFMILIFRIGYLQIVKNTISYERVTKNRERIVRVPPIRGKIYSADGKVIAENIRSFDIILEPQSFYEDIHARQQELLYLSQILNIEYSDIEKLIAERKKQKEIYLAENISYHQFAKIQENIDRLPGIVIKENLLRKYPYEKTLSHAIGYIGPISSEELAIMKDQGYLQIDYVGKNGVEKAYESYLRGEAGKKVYEIDARLNIIGEIRDKEVEPLPGDEIVLTIDLDFQKNVEDILADRIGTIIVTKPATGEIIALASYPNFDPNIYIFPTEKNLKEIKKIDLDTRGTPLINRSIQAEYSPGSVFKMVLGMIILEENIVPIYKEYYCTGEYRLNYDSFGCWNVHHSQNLEEAIYNSCDVYFYNTSQKIGPTRINKYSKKFGFNKKTDIDLPFEKEGLIPSIEWMKEKGGDWQTGLTLIMAIGQGDVKVTPLQLANYISVISNKGISYKPHIVKQIRSSLNGEIKHELQPEVLSETKHQKENYAFIHTAMRKTITQGTAERAFLRNPHKFAGKTGTAEIGFGPKKQTNSFFTGFGPIDLPIEEQIVVVVLIESYNNDSLKYAADIANMVCYSYYQKTDFIETAKKVGYPIRDTYNIEKEEEEE
ncbi:MAG: penicillin-binding protein 2 [Spirochaetes bacterium]|nr:penicillin-binding protein 2 [Spirochaetota bacterium]